MNLKWFVSSKYRKANEMTRQVRKLLNHQRDILSENAIQKLEAAVGHMKSVLADRAVTPETLSREMTELEESANKWLKPYPNASIRENIEVFLIAIAVAVGVRTFFLQPFKIPTGSMQPTLYGITSEPLDEEFEIPNRLSRLWQYWVNGTAYYDETARASGQLAEIKPPVRFLLFNLKQDYRIGNEWQTVWFPTDGLFGRAGLVLQNGRPASAERYEIGDPVVRLRVNSGDHLFVDRFSYNFRPPDRGEIIVFATKDTQIREQDQFYIKRLIAEGGESVSIGDDNHVVVDGVRLDASTPRFEHVYGFDPSEPGRDSHYFGHANGTVARRSGRSPAEIAPHFFTEDDTYVVPDDSYIAFGDNTLNSSDSRKWGAVPKRNVIGKAFFVYWPITPRFGVGAAR